MFSKCLGFLLTFFLLVNSNYSFSQEQAKLTVSPNVCAVQNSQDGCHLDIKLNWQLPTANEVCLSVSGKPLKCWINAATGSFSYKAEVQFQSVYSLVNRQTGEVLASATIDVQSANIKAQRRRLRSPWSFF